MIIQKLSNNGKTAIGQNCAIFSLSHQVFFLNQKQLVGANEKHSLPIPSLDFAKVIFSYILTSQKYYFACPDSAKVSFL